MRIVRPCLSEPIMSRFFEHSIAPKSKVRPSRASLEKCREVFQCRSFNTVHANISQNLIEAIQSGSISGAPATIATSAPAQLRLLKKRAAGFENTLDVRTELSAIDIHEKVRGYHSSASWQPLTLAITAAAAASGRMASHLSSHGHAKRHLPVAVRLLGLRGRRRLVGRRLGRTGIVLYSLQSQHESLGVIR